MIDIKYLFLRKNQITKDGIIYEYEGLNSNLFEEIYYSENMNSAVVKTSEDNISDSFMVISEQEFESHKNSFNAGMVRHPESSRNEDFEPTLWEHILFENKYQTLLLEMGVM